jgi:protein TonB
VSIALHALVVFLLVVSTAATVALTVDLRSWGLRGPNQGGGGGGNVQERLRYVRVAPPPPVVRTPPRPVPPRVVPPKPIPAAIPPPTVPPAVPPTGQQLGDPGPAAPGAGAGPGTGGGVGAGTGPGVGNGTGPGTGGTPTVNKLKAELTEWVPPSLGDPPRDRPFHLVATFEVSERGDGRLLSVSKSKDGAFNKRAMQDLESARFRAATLPDGTPVKDTIQITTDY